MDYAPFYTVAISKSEKDKNDNRSMHGLLTQMAGYSVTNKNNQQLRLIVCVDADSKYLYETPWYLNKPYIFHTYAYSIENYNCFGEFLNQKFAEYSLNQISTIDFVQLFKDFSLALSTLFCYWVYNKSTYKPKDKNRMKSNEVGKEKQKEIMSVEKFCAYLKKSKIDLQTAQNEILTEISKRVKECIDELENNYGKLIDENTKQEMLDKFKTQYGIEEQDLFLYFKGHWIFEEFLIPIAQYQFWYLKEEFLSILPPSIDKKSHEEAVRRINNQFGETEAESNIKIKTIVEKIHEIAIHHKISPINKIWEDLLSTSF